MELARQTRFAGWKGNPSSGISIFRTSRGGMIINAGAQCQAFTYGFIPVRSSLFSDYSTWFLYHPAPRHRSVLKVECVPGDYELPNRRHLDDEDPIHRRARA
jgi:hypothetical protein